jgi:CRISPR-associated protein Cmr4
MREQLIIGLLAESSIHAGADSSEEGAVDLPIQREGHTGWPVIFGSSLKGALRSMVNSHGIEFEEAWFGNAFSGSHEIDKQFAGAMMVSDARLLWLPVRSLTSHVKYVSCPALMMRFERDLRRVGQTISADKLALLTANIDEDKAVIFNRDDKDQIFLEEYRFQPNFIGETHVEEAKEALRILADLNEDISKGLMEKRFTLVADDVFAHLCQAAIPVQPHIALDYETKTARSDTGALWYEELLPADTQLYSLFGFNRARNDTSDKGLTAKQLADSFTQRILNGYEYLQIGANESTGMGWCHLKAFGQEVK